MINVIYLSFICYNTFNYNLKLNLGIVAKFVAVFPFDCWSTQVVESYSFSRSSTSNVSNNRIFCQVSVWLFVPCFENQQSSKHFQRKHFFHSSTKNGFYYVDTHANTHTRAQLSSRKAVNYALLLLHINSENSGYSHSLWSYLNVKAWKHYAQPYSTFASCDLTKNKFQVSYIEG